MCKRRCAPWSLFREPHAAWDGSCVQPVVPSGLSCTHILMLSCYHVFKFSFCGMLSPCGHAVLLQAIMPPHYHCQPEQRWCHPRDLDNQRSWWLGAEACTISLRPSPASLVKQGRGGTVKQGRGATVNGHTRGGGARSYRPHV